jgi:hypothetical protein
VRWRAVSGILATVLAQQLGKGEAGHRISGVRMVFLSSCSDNFDQLSEKLDDGSFVSDTCV